MSISTVKAGLDDIAIAIRTERQASTSAKARLTAARNNLVSLATTHAGTIAEIMAYSETGDPFEILSKDEFTKLVAEYTALKNELDGVVLSLENTVEI